MSHGRLRTTLVYFGLVHDDAERERLEGSPTKAWQVAAALVALLLGVAIALGVLAAFGITPTVATAADLLIGAGAVSGALAITRKLGGRRDRSSPR